MIIQKQDIVISDGFCTTVTTVQELMDHGALINGMFLMLFEDGEMVYNSIDTVVNADEAVHYSVEFVNIINPPDLTYHKLTERVGIRLTLLRNLKMPKLCNGTRLQVKTLYPNIIETTILGGYTQGEMVFVPRIPLIPNNIPFEFKRLQFRLKVCFTIVINKSQEKTLKISGIDFRQDCFSHVQFYMECSRCKLTSKPRYFVTVFQTG